MALNWLENIILSNEVRRYAAIGFVDEVLETVYPKSRYDVYPHGHAEGSPACPESPSLSTIRNPLSPYPAIERSGRHLPCCSSMV